MKRLTKILVSVFSAGLFASLVVGSTLALYASEKTVNNHLVSGDMQAMLYLKELKNDVLENNGHITEDVAVDLSGYAGYEENLSYVDADEQTVAFNGVNLSTYDDEVFQVEKIVPTMRGSAEFIIMNNGSDSASDSVAFEFQIELKNKEGDAELVDQVEVTLENAEWSGNDNYVESQHGHSFTVKWEFLDQDDNNDAMNQGLSFDIQVTCVQETAQHS